MTSSEFSARLGVSVGHLNRMVRAGLVEPSVRSRKQGSREIWSEQDVAVVESMLAAQKLLTQLGRCRVPAVRLSRLGDRVALAVGSSAVVDVTPGMTVVQLVRSLGGAFAVIPREDT